MRSIALCALGFTLLIAAGEPKWFMTGSLTGYPKEFNYIGVGSGSTFSDARSIAQAAIAGQLNVSITATLNMSVQEIEENDAYYYKNVFNENIQSTVDQSVSGIEIVKNKKYKNSYYVFAVLNKERYANSLRVELDGLNSTIKSYVLNARESIGEGKIFVAIQHYIDVQEFIPTFYSKKAFYNAIAPVPFIINENLSLGVILSEMGDIISGIKVGVVSGDKQSVISGRPLHSPVVFNATFGKRSAPIAEMPLAVRYESGDLAARGVTDRDGNFEAFIIGYSNGNPSEKIIAGPNFSGLQPVFKKYLKNTSTTATYKITTTPPISFTLSIKDPEGERLEKVESKIIKNIERLGHFVSDGANLALNGNVSIIDKKEVEGKSGTQYLVTAELDLFLSENINDTKVGSFTASGKGLSKKNYSDANDKAYQRFKISQRNLSGMLGKADNKLKQVFTKQSAKKLAKGKTLYSQGKLTDALIVLTEVTHDKKQSEEAIELIDKIKTQLNKAQSDKLDRLKEEKRKKREHELSLARVAAETELERLRLENEQLLLKQVEQDTTNNE